MEDSGSLEGTEATAERFSKAFRRQPLSLLFSLFCLCLSSSLLIIILFFLGISLG
jgi:hypothetical protein